MDGNNLFTVSDKDVVITDLKPDIEDEDVTRATIPGRSPLILFGPKINNHQEYVVFLTRDGKGINLVNNAFPFEVVSTEEVSQQLISLLLVFKNHYKIFHRTPMKRLSTLFVRQTIVCILLEWMERSKNGELWIEYQQLLKVLTLVNQ